MIILYHYIKKQMKLPIKKINLLNLIHLLLLSKTKLLEHYTLQFNPFRV
jgi:hypothetical protein